MPRRRGVTLVEFLVVLAIISVLIALTLPAIQAARTRARDAVCQNHLRQLSLAMQHFAEVHKKAPTPSPPGKVGGWAIAILPFMEEGNLADFAVDGAVPQAAPRELLKQPKIMRCPAQEYRDEETGEGMRYSHYVAIRNGDVLSTWVSDSPKGLNVPWATSPTVEQGRGVKPGPHFKGFYQCYGYEHGTSWVEGI